MDKVAQVLAFYARHRASDPKYASPFAYAAFQVGLRGYFMDVDLLLCAVLCVLCCSCFLLLLLSGVGQGLLDCAVI